MLESLPPRTAPPRLAGIAALGSDDAIGLELARLGNACGPVSSVLSLTSAGGAERRDFLVTFERAQDALNASRQWRCYLFGFTSVLVSVQGSAVPQLGGQGA